MARARGQHLTKPGGRMAAREFAAAEMTCIVEAVHDAGEVAVLEWRDPLGLRGSSR